MLDTILYFAHGTLLLLFGVSLSEAFAGIRFHRNTLLQFLGFSALLGLVQILAYINLGNDMLWKVYPLITHFPLVFFLFLAHRKSVATSIVAVTTAYLCCQPAKWFGVLTLALTGSTTATYLARIITMILVATITLRYLAPSLATIFNKDSRSVCIFGIMPIVYYLFDYATMIYTDLWANNNRIVAEFLPFFLGITYMIFCLVYYREYEQKNEAERKEQLIRVTADSQAKEMEAVKRSEQEVRLLRHDMRHLLNSVAVCLEDGDLSKAQSLIHSYASHIEGTKLKRFCQNDTINYVLSDVAAKCDSLMIRFTYSVELDKMNIDELLFSSILSNALDNALNAQKLMPTAQRQIQLTLKSAHGKLLLSVENPTAMKPVFVDGLPISSLQGHGYGTQSIRYMTERLGGNCQFLMQEDMFIVRVVI